MRTIETIFRGVEDGKIITFRSTDSLDVDERVKLTDEPGNSIEATVLGPVEDADNLYRAKIDPETWSYA
jgi:hypothetical protein